MGKPWLDPALPPLPPLDAGEKLQLEIFSRMTPYQRWEKAQALRDMVWGFRRSELKRNYPDWPPEKIEGAVRDYFIRATT